MSLGPVGQQIEQKLTNAFRPIDLQVVDQSSQHAGHAGARPEGETHFHVKVISEEFRGKTLVNRHRMINEVLADELKTRVHALAISAAAPET